jgi:hypothetical protein
MNKNILHSDNIKKMPIIDFLESLITAMNSQNYDVIHIDQLIDIRNKIKKELL